MDKMKDKSKSGAVHAGNPAAKSATRPCPICKQPAVTSYRPFCSRRCADIDLGRWFKGSYAIHDEVGVADMADTDSGTDFD